MNRRDLEQLIRSIQSLVRCPSCGASYHTNMITVVGGSNHTFLVHLECSRCGLSTMATVMFRQQRSVNADGYEEIGEFSINSMPVDASWLPKETLSPGLSPTREKESEVTSDDVLDMHQFLKDFDGDFESYLSE